jgi:hypothetical protein
MIKYLASMEYSVLVDNLAKTGTIISMFILLGVVIYLTIKQ